VKGEDVMANLQKRLREGGFWGFQGEPDLFCWLPDSGRWFFAEAKGKDGLLETQRRWFEVCRKVIPGVDIRVYRVLPTVRAVGAGRSGEQFGTIDYWALLIDIA
jgi:hypothetical protein